MRLAAALFVCSSALVFAEIHEFTLKQTVERAIRNNPDIQIARYEELKAVENVQPHETHSHQSWS